MSEIKEFKTESKKILDLMINSIYTNREIFLRELISNASDAIDKYHFLSLNDEKLEKRNDYKIHISLDKENRSITIEDNGIGMTYDELNENLGTIARSGSKEFLKKIEENSESKDEIDIIGQFGVGFYSSFIVADKVIVDTKSPYSDKAYRFISSGTDTYEIEEINKENIGSKITLFLRKDPSIDLGKEQDEDYVANEDSYDVFLEEYEIRHLVKKYSDYIRYPITMMITSNKPKLDADGKVIEGEYEDEVKEETLNSMIPLWKKNKNEVTKEQLNQFYREKFYGFEEPFTSLFLNIEGLISYNAIVYIPSKAPYDLYSDKYEKGLQLYSKGVFIMDKCKDLIPDYLRFVKGLVDSSDLSLNISREILQQNRQLQMIAKNLEKKILGELEKIRDNEFDKYVNFFEQFGVNLKWGIYDGYGAKKDLLKDLIIYKSINHEEPITLKKYIEEMKEGQEFIYYAAGKTKSSVMAMPQMDMIKQQGFDVLILSDDIDEFVLTILQEYEGKKFKSISQGDLDLLSNEEKQELDMLKETKKPLLEKLKEVLHGEVNDVVLSKRLKDSPVCLVSSDGISIEMEKVLSQSPLNQDAKATKILEINPRHELFKAIENIYDKAPDELENYASLLYNQALLIEGLPIKDPVEFSKLMCDLMIKSVK